MNIGGKELKITIASFDEAMDLKRAIGKSLLSNGINIDLDNISEDNLKNDSVMGILKAIISVGISKEVETCLFNCGARCIIGVEKVDKDFFEKPENRQWYYQIMLEIIKANLLPFFSGLLSGFSGLQKKIGSILKQK